MPWRRHTSAVFSPASASRKLPIICASLNRLPFIGPSPLGDELYANSRGFSGGQAKKAAIGKKFLSEINDEDIILWKLEIEEKRTPQKKPLSTRRKNMSLDVLCQILRLAKRRGLANDRLLIDARPFKNEENEDEVNLFTEDEVESLLKASE
jgi:hypothetical protein